MLHLARILGGRLVPVFATVTLLVVAVLASVNVTSRSALKPYPDDQLARLAWDYAVYQTDISAAADVRQQLASMPAVERVEDVLFLRTVLPPDVQPRVDGVPLTTPMLSLLAATDPELLPPDVRPPSPDRGVLALVGPESRMGSAFQALQGTTRFQLAAAREAPGVSGLEVPLGRTVRLDRSELNRWFTDRTNTPSFVPDIGTILVVPLNGELGPSYDRLARAIAAAGEEDQAADPGHIESGSYFPEAIHLVRGRRAGLISGWDLPGSSHKLASLGERLLVSSTD